MNVIAPVCRFINVVFSMIYSGASDTLTCFHMCTFIQNNHDGNEQEGMLMSGGAQAAVYRVIGASRDVFVFSIHRISTRFYLHDPFRGQCPISCLQNVVLFIVFIMLVFYLLCELFTYIVPAYTDQSDAKLSSAYLCVQIVFTYDCDYFCL